MGMEERMLVPAQLYRDEINKKMIKGWYNLDNMYYHDSPASYMIDLPDNNSEIHCLASISNGEVIGYISYCVDYQTMSADNFKFISFDKGNLTFVDNIHELILALFLKYNFNRVAWQCYADDPAIQVYRKLINEFGGREAAYLRQTTKLLDGKIHDSVIFEILREDIIIK